MEGNVVLTMRDISKTFPGVKALQHVDFTLRKGEIHLSAEPQDPIRIYQRLLQDLLYVRSEL